MVVGRELNSHSMDNSTTLSSKPYTTYLIFPSWFRTESNGKCGCGLEVRKLLNYYVPTAFQNLSGSLKIDTNFSS